MKHNCIKARHRRQRLNEHQQWRRLRDTASTIDSQPAMVEVLIKMESLRYGHSKHMERVWRDFYRTPGAWTIEELRTVALNIYNDRLPWATSAFRDTIARAIKKKYV